jgi:adenine/guanine phosphoribosyltransferase-like PRPP-binding protein
LGTRRRDPAQVIDLPDLAGGLGSDGVAVGSQHADLPLVPLGDDLAIALMMTIDLGVRFTATAGAKLARLLAPAHPECVASVATLGIPVAVEVTRALGLDDYLILPKTAKIHLRDALRERRRCWP